MTTRRELIDKLRRLLGPEGLEAAGVDVSALERGGRLPDWLEHLVQAAETLPLPEVPPVVSQDLHRIFDVVISVESERAVLVRDTRDQRALAGVRGSDTSEGWSMIYTSPSADVVLDVWPQPDGSLDVGGHVMAHRSAESAYRATLDGPTPARADGDRLGRFRVAPLEPGRYTMVIGNGEMELVLQADLSGEDD